jgi:hypothetical protein
MGRVAAILACLVLAACDGVEIKPGETSHNRRDIPPGPGLVSGEQGEFVLFRRFEEPADDENAGE